MSESHRSESFGAYDDGEGDAAELEHLRREAALLREQLNSVSGGHRSREVQQLEARIDSLGDRKSVV
jgi:proteasome-associated ATPase